MQLNQKTLTFGGHDGQVGLLVPPDHAHFYEGKQPNFEVIKTSNGQPYAVAPNAKIKVFRCLTRPADHIGGKVFCYIDVQGWNGKADQNAFPEYLFSEGARTLKELDKGAELTMWVFEPACRWPIELSLCVNIWGYTPTALAEKYPFIFMQDDSDELSASDPSRPFLIRGANRAWQSISQTTPLYGLNETSPNRNYVKRITHAVDLKFHDLKSTALNEHGSITDSGPLIEASSCPRKGFPRVMFTKPEPRSIHGGYANTGSKFAVVREKERLDPFVAAHELGHLFQLGDEEITVSDPEMPGWLLPNCRSADDPLIPALPAGADGNPFYPFAGRDADGRLMPGCYDEAHLRSTPRSVMRSDATGLTDLHEATLYNPVSCGYVSAALKGTLERNADVVKPDGLRKMFCWCCTLSRVVGSCDAAGLQSVCQ